MSGTMKKLAAAYAAEVIKNRRYLHAHPELSFHETNTAQWIRDHLAAIGIPTLSGITGNSTVGVLKGTQPGPSIGFRADIDALGLTEMNDLPYKSTHTGTMHACGHDAHTAVLMAMAEIFASHRELVHGTIYFVFQQGEEFLPGGAQQLVKDGIMDRIDYMFAWHAAALEKVGTVDVAAGVREAAVGTYDIKITGKGGHGGFPHKANNPVIPAAELVSAINLIPALKCDPLENCTVSVSYFQCGIDGVANVIPERVSMGGNARVLNTDLRDFVMKEIERLAKAICAAHQCQCDVSLVYGYPANTIDATCNDIFRKAAASMGLTVLDNPPVLGAEDFAYYAQKKPAGIAKLGMADPTGAIAPTSHHNPCFYIDDEKGLPLALEYMLTVYETALQELM